MLDLDKRPMYVVGAAETPLGVVSDHSELSMIAVAAKEALAEAGMTLADIDGIFTAGIGKSSSVQVGEYLGIQPRYADSSDHGGGQFEAHVGHAVAAIDAGLCEVALIAFASRIRSKRGRMPRGWNDYNPTASDSLVSQFEEPYGLFVMVGHFALIAARHMHQFGTTRKQLAEVAVAARTWAQLNPKAFKRDPITVDDVLASPLRCDPLHNMDCCLITDGGGAVIVTNAARAKSAVKKPVRIIGLGEKEGYWHIWANPDLMRWPGYESAKQALGMAGIKPTDIDVFNPYDAYTINTIIEMEEIGICQPGEGGAFIEEGHTLPGGSFPSSTSGGGLSYNHPGKFGLLLLIETVRQVRGEAGARQVPNVTIGVGHGPGGVGGNINGTVVLAKE